MKAVNHLPKNKQEARKYLGELRNSGHDPGCPCSACLRCKNLISGFRFSARQINDPQVVARQERERALLEAAILTCPICHARLEWPDHKGMHGKKPCKAAHIHQLRLGELHPSYYQTPIPTIVHGKK